MAEEDLRDLLADSSLDVIDSVPKFEEVLRKHKKSLAENLNVMSMLMNPCSFNNIISEKKQEEIRKIYSNKGSVKAAEMFVGAILRSKDETKWSVFKEALQRSEGNELIKDILRHGVTKSLIIHENNKRQIILQRGSITEKWHTEHIYEALRQEQLLTSQEYEEVQAVHLNQGSKAANYHILTMVPRRKDFLPKLLKILYDLGYRQSVKDVDLDFFRKMEERGDFKDCSEKLDTSDNDDDNANESVDNNVPGDEETCTNAVGRNYMEHSSFPIGDDNMALNICTGLLNDEKVTNTVKMMNDSSINNLNLPDNDDPIASRTRSKTKLREMKEPGATTLNEPVFEHSQPLTPKRPTGTLDRQTVTSHSQTEAPHKARETSLVEQTAVQRPKYNSLDSSRKYAQSKDTATQVSLNRFSKETGREANLTTCECGELFICLDELRQHQSTKCKVTVKCSTKQQCELLLGRDGQVAQGARLETERLQATGFDQYFLQRVVESRQPGTSCTPIETLPAAQNVVQLPACDISIKSSPDKGAAATEVRFQVGNRQTTHGVKFVNCVCEKRFVSKDDLRKHQNSDCQVKVGRYQDIKCELGRGAPTGTGLQEGSQQTNQKVNFLSCISNEQLIPKDTWRKHQSTDCQVKLSKQAEPCKGAGTSASLQEGKQTNQKANLVTCACGKRFISEDTLKKHQSVDCQVILGHYRDNQYVPEKQEANPIVLQEGNKPIQDKVKARQEEVIASKHKPKFDNETVKIDRNKCTKCGNRFQSQEYLQRHIRISCRAMQNQAVSEETLPKSFYEEHSPMAKTKSKQADIQSDHSNTGNSMKPNRNETTEGKSDHHIAMQKSPQVTRQQNAQGREISPLLPMTTLRQEDNKLIQDKAKVLACICEKRFVSEDAMRKHQNTDCRLILGPHKNPDSSGSLTLARQEEAIASKPKHKLDKETAKGNRNKCSKCGLHFISLDRLQRHIAFSCRAMQNQAVSEEALRIHQNTDCKLILGPHKNPDSSEGLTLPRPEEAIASKSKLKLDEETARDRNTCPKCGNRFQSQERLQRHIRFCGRAIQNQAVSEETLPKSFYVEQSPVANTKSKKPMVLQEDNKPIQDKAKARQEEAIASKPELKFDNETARVDRNKCPKCGNRFKLQEYLQRHIEFNCKATQNQIVSEETLPKSFYEEHSPMAKTKSKQVDIQSDHSNTANSMQPNGSETTKEKSDHYIAMQKSPQVTQQQNAQGREISPRVTMRTLRNSNSDDPEKSAQTKSGKYNSNQTSSLTEHFQRSSTHNSNQTSSLTEHSQRSSTDSFSSSAHSNESLGSNSNQDTVESNDRSQSQISNTDGRETPQNRRQNNRRQEEPSAGGFGFQSTRTLRLNKDR